VKKKNRRLIRAAREARGIARGEAETTYLLWSPVNAARLRQSIEDADAGKMIEFDPTTRTHPK
jgi:hypothetical protein